MSIIHLDAPLIHAPTSTKDCEQKRDPEMHQAKKGKQWYFGMKAHVGVDSKTKLIHTALVTPANVADATVLPELLHGEETRVWGDQAYRGQSGRFNRAHHARTTAPIGATAIRTGSTKWNGGRTKASPRVRSKVEHVFGVMKLKFGFVKVRYRGLVKNANRLFAPARW